MIHAQQFWLRHLASKRANSASTRCISNKDRYRWRAGIEATISEYDRRTGVKRLRVRGFKAVHFCSVLKAVGLNILRAAAVMAAVIAEMSEKIGPKGGYCCLISNFKEQFWAALVFVVRLLSWSPEVISIYSRPVL